MSADLVTRANAAPRRIIAMGGYPDDAVLDHALALARGRRLLFVPTASMEDPTLILDVHDRLAARAEVTDLGFQPWPPPDLRSVALGHDAILVGGGNTANMLAIWRVHGFDRILRDAWTSGVLLMGWSAGMICWYEAGVTDSFGPQLEGMPDGLGLLPGSACPHFDGEERRRPVYTRLVGEGFPAGIALDDGAAAHYHGTELVEVVAGDPASRGYRVSATGEEVLPTRVLGEGR